MPSLQIDELVLFWSQLQVKKQISQWSLKHRFFSNPLFKWRFTILLKLRKPLAYLRMLAWMSYQSLPDVDVTRLRVTGLAGRRGARNRGVASTIRLSVCPVFVPDYSRITVAYPSHLPSLYPPTHNSLNLIPVFSFSFGLKLYNLMLYWLTCSISIVLIHWRNF